MRGAVVTGVQTCALPIFAAAAMVAVRALVALVAMVPMRALVPVVATIDLRRVVSPGARTVAAIALDAVLTVAVAVVAVRPVVARTIAAGSLRLAIALVSRQVSLLGEAPSVIDSPNCPCAAPPGSPTPDPNTLLWQGRRATPHT